MTDVRNVPFDAIRVGLHSAPNFLHSIRAPARRRRGLGIISDRDIKSARTRNAAVAYATEAERRCHSLFGHFRIRSRRLARAMTPAINLKSDASSEPVRERQRHLKRRLIVVAGLRHEHEVVRGFGRQTRRRRRDRAVMEAVHPIQRSLPEYDWLKDLLQSGKSGTMFFSNA